MHAIQCIQLGCVEIVHRCVVHDLRIEPLQLCLEFADLGCVLVQERFLTISGLPTMLVKVFVDLGEVCHDLLILCDLFVCLDQLLLEFLNLVLFRLDALLECLLLLLGCLAQVFPLFFDVVEFALLLK